MKGPTRRFRHLVSIAAALALIAPSASLGPPAAAGPRYRATSYRVARGMTYTRIIDSRGPNRIRVLTVDPATALTLDVALARNRLPGHERPSSMAARHRAIAAINGDYTIRPSYRGAGRPVNSFMEDGRLVTSPLIWGRNFAIARNKRDAYFGHRDLRVALVQHDSGRRLAIAGWNPMGGGGSSASAWTPAGGRTFPPRRNACSARLGSPSSPRWSAERLGLERDYVVERVRCASQRLARRGRIVVAARRGTAAAAVIRNQLKRGERVTLAWSMNWRGVMDTIGGNPTLLENGRKVAGECTDSYFCGRNPRTGIGVTTDGRLLLVTVDGRRRGYSVGMTLPELTHLFRYLGATSALNLDGGGSTVMVVKGRVMNRPSDGRERPVGSALLVLPGRDRGEKSPARPSGTVAPPHEPDGGILPELPPDVPPTTGGVTPVPQTDPSCLALGDPGSTGGMLDAVARGDLGGPRVLPRSLQSAVDVFRGRSPCGAGR